MFNKALVIDDDKASRKLVQYFFEKMGCVTAEASDGELGSLCLLNEEQNVLILDWRMPKISGSETLILVDSILRQVRNPIIQSPLPTILYTSVLLDELELPETKYFKIKGYVHKKWPVEIQRRHFRRILNSLRSLEAA